MRSAEAEVADEVLAEDVAEILALDEASATDHAVWLAAWELGWFLDSLELRRQVEMLFDAEQPLVDLCPECEQVFVWPQSGPCILCMDDALMTTTTKATKGEAKP